jgi:hypothetical protein
LFSFCAQALIELANDWIVPSGGDGGHVKRGTDSGAAPADAAQTAQFSAVVVVGCQAGQCGGFAATERAEFRHLRQECMRGGRTDAGNGLEKVVFFLPDGAGFNGGIDVLVEIVKLSVESGEDAFDGLDDARRAGQFETVAFGGAQGDELRAASDQFGEDLRIGVRKRAHDRPNGVGEVSENGGVESVIFGELSGGFGKVADLAWMTTGMWQAANSAAMRFS